MTFIVVGICIGVVLTAGRVPKVRWAPLAVPIVLLLLAVFGFREMKPISLSEAFLLLISAILAAALYAGALWDRQKLDPQVNAWGGHGASSPTLVTLGHCIVSVSRPPDSR